MDVILDLDIEGGNSIPIEISPMEFVAQIKERVQTSHHIPFSRQNLFFNGQLLQDCVSIQETRIDHGSSIKLVIATDAAANLPPPPPLPSQSYSPPSEWSTIVLDVKLPGLQHRIPIEMNMHDTVLKLKKEILAQETMRIFSAERLSLQTHQTSVELLQGQILRYCPVLDCDVPDNEIDVFLKPPPRLAVPAPGCTYQSGKLNLSVLPMNSKHKIENIEVNADDKVQVLREIIEDTQRKSNRFGWNKVQNGDTIDAAEDDDKSSSSIAIPDQNLTPKVPNPTEVISDVSNTQKVLQGDIYEEPSNMESSSEERWVRVKSAGATSRYEQKSACGGVLENRSDAFMAGYCKLLEECPILRAELYGILHGIRLAKAKGFTEIEVVSVSAEAIELVSNNCMEGHAEYELVKLIRSLYQGQPLTISWSHFTGDQSKRLEYCFAQHGLALENDEPTIYDLHLPQFISDMLIDSLFSPSP